MRKITQFRPGGSLVLVLFAVYMLVPLLATLNFSLTLGENYTTVAYEKLLRNEALFEALWHSLLLATLTVLGSLILTLPTLYWVQLKLPQAKPLLEFFTLLPFIVPPIVMALGLIRIYSSGPFPITGTPQILVFSYMMVSLPFMFRAIDNALQSIDTHTLTEAAQSLRAGTFTTLRYIIIPNILPGIVSGSLLVFSSALAEFALANLLVGSAWTTFPVFVSNVGRADGRQAAALAVISFVITWLVSITILWSANRAPGQNNISLNR